MKNALLLIPEIIENVNKQRYLGECIEHMADEGYLSLSPGMYEYFFKIESEEYIANVLPHCDAVFFFVDFGIDGQMFKVIDAWLDKIPFHYRRVSMDSVNKVIYSLDQLLMKTANETGISVDLMKSKMRMREVNDARYVYFRAARSFTSCSYKAIGEKVLRDHATVMHGENVANTVPEVIKLYDRIYGKARSKKASLEQSSDGDRQKQEPVERPVLPFRSMDPREQAFQRREPIVCGMQKRGFSEPVGSYRPHNS